MARSRVNLRYIANGSKRRNSFRKRSRGLLSKIHELNVLCGVHACGVIYSPEEATPHVWPETEDARRILTSFNNLPEVERTRKMTDHATFMRERVATLRDKVAKLNNENVQRGVRAVVNEGFYGSNFEGISAPEIFAAGYALDDLISKVHARISEMSLPPQATTE